jgi:type I restriction enzyme, S subunit
MGQVLRKLPPGWVEATIGDVTAKKVPQLVPPPDADFTYIDIASIDNGTKEVKEPKSLNGKEAPSRARQSILAGDVLVSMTRPNLNAVAMVPEELDDTIASTGFDVLRAVQVEPRWLFTLVRSEDFVREMTAGVQGALYPAIRGENIRSYLIPVPPLREQKRIVVKIEELQGHSRRAREALEAIPDRLDYLRQSVLAAAFRGDLTRKWREGHPDVEHASELLKRIRIERRKLWEEAELEKLKAKGLTGEKLDSEFAKRRNQYKEPMPVDSSDLPELPEGWCWTNWDHLSDWITYGFTRTMPHVDDGPLIVTAKNIKSGSIDFSNAAHTTNAAYFSLSPKDKPETGDILITKDGTIGRAAIVYDNRPMFCINQSVAVIWLRSRPLIREFLLGLIEAPQTQKRIEENAKGIAIRHLSITDFAKITLPLPPLEEQKVISDNLAEVFTKIVSIEYCVSMKKKLLIDMDQAILSKAFRGELVQQNLNDEPASALLDRIREEKALASVEEKTKAKRKGRRGKRQPLQFE